MRTTMIVRLFTALALMAFASCAQAAEWTVQKTFGEVWLQSSDVQKVALTPGHSLKGKTTIVTGTNGKVVLVRDTESMIVGPNATVTVPGPNILGHTTIRQRAALNYGWAARFRRERLVIGSACRSGSGSKPLVEPWLPLLTLAWPLA